MSIRIENPELADWFKAQRKEPTMTIDEARRKMQATNQAVGLACSILGVHRETIDQFLVEEASVDTIMPLLDPTRWMNPEYQKARKTITPLYQAVLALLRAFDEVKTSHAEVED